MTSEDYPALPTQRRLLGCQVHPPDSCLVLVLDGRSITLEQALSLLQNNALCVLANPWSLHYDQPMLTGRHFEMQ